MFLTCLFFFFVLFFYLCFFFFKQKTAYEMRISDWSSDVCSSDLPRGPVASLPFDQTFSLCSIVQAPSRASNLGIPQMAYPIPAPAALSAAGVGMAAWTMAVCNCPARSLMADTSLPRSLVKMVADSLARDMPT